MWKRHQVNRLITSSLAFLCLTLGFLIHSSAETPGNAVIQMRGHVYQSNANLVCTAYVNNTEVGLMTKIFDSTNVLVRQYCTPFRMQLPTDLYTITCTFFSPQRVDQTHQLNIVSGGNSVVNFNFSARASSVPSWRGVVYHSDTVPDSGRLSNPSYYGPHINQMADQFHCNVVTAVLFFVRPTDTYFIRGDTQAPLTCLESREEVDIFLSYCSNMGMKVIFRLFGYPYGKGNWNDFRQDGYMNISEWESVDRWIDYYVGYFANDSRILAWEVFNEPYFRNPSEPEFNDILMFVEHVADYIKTVHDPNQPITLGSLHVYYNYDSFAVLELHGRRKISDYFDIIGFHSYGPMPYESITNTPDNLTSAALSFGKLAVNLEFGTPRNFRDIVNATWNITGQAQFFADVCQATELHASSGILGCSVWHLPYMPNYPFELIEPDCITPNVAGEAIIHYYDAWSRQEKK